MNTKCNLPLIIGTLVVAGLGAFIGGCLSLKLLLPTPTAESKKQEEGKSTQQSDIERQRRVESETEPAAKSMPTGTDGKTARVLVSSSSNEKTRLVEERLQTSTSRSTVSVDNIHLVAADLNFMNSVLTLPEHLDSPLLDKVEKERDRILKAMKDSIPALVKELDDVAIKSKSSKEALSNWAKGGAVLGYYPASNIPSEAAMIQNMVSDHEGIRTRIALVQRQQYNAWACDQIRKATLDFADSGMANVGSEYLGPIEPNHLDPVTMEVYREFLEAIKKKVPKEDFQELATRLAKSKRVLPGEEKQK